MTEQPTPPRGEGFRPGRLGVDVGALERAAAGLEHACGSLLLGSTRLVHTASDPGEPPASDHVVDLQQAASDALLALSRGLEESATLLVGVVQHYRGAEADVARSLGRAGAERA